MLAHQSTFSLHMLRVFFNASLKNSGDALFKSRGVPARAKNLYSNVRFSLHVLRVFLNASLKNSGMLCLNLGVSLHVLKISSYFFNLGSRLNLKVFIDFIEHPTDFMYNTMLFASFFTDLEA